MRTLVLDMDSTITDFWSALLGAYNEKYQDNVDLAKVKTWDVHQYCQHGEKVYECMRVPGFFRSLSPFPNAVEVIESLSGKYFIHIATAAQTELEIAEKLEWIHEHLPFIPEAHVHFTGQTNKNDVAGDVLFDDAPHNLKKYPGTTVALRYPYNANCADIYVSDWLEFHNLLK